MGTYILIVLFAAIFIYYGGTIFVLGVIGALLLLGVFWLAQFIGLGLAIGCAGLVIFTIYHIFSDSKSKV